MPPLSAASVSLPSRYRLVRHIAHGGMAGVWEAYDELLARPVAVKVLATHLGEDQRARARFQREARAVAGLSSHPHVVTIYDVGEHEGRSFMVMELMRGGSVADRLRTGERVPTDMALRWLAEAAEALDAAHEAGIVHRDVKPANMLLDARDRLALGDFGIARVAWEDQVTLTGQVLGTAAYVSPEQAMGEPATPASDRYSLAVVAFELLTGDRPFRAEHFAAQARAHVEAPPPAASEREPTLPPAVDDVLDRGLAKDPAQRPPSAAALVSGLRDALGTPTRPIAAGPREWPTHAPEPPPRRRGARAWALGGLAALLVAGGATAAVVAGDDDAGETQRAERREARQDATPTPEPTATATPEPEPTATATATPEPTPTATPEPTPTQEAPAAPTGSDPAQLNDEGYVLFQQERYAEAVPYFQRAVEQCGDSGELSPCGFALYNLGASLNRSGNPQDAIPVLEQRLERFGDNDQGDVRAELRDARRAAGES